MHAAIDMDDEFLSRALSHCLACCIPPVDRLLLSVCTPLLAATQPARPGRTLSHFLHLFISLFSTAPSPPHPRHLLRCSSTSLSHCQTRHAHVRARRRHKPAAVARLSSSCPSSTGHPCPTLYPPTPFQKPKRTLHVRSVPRCETCPSHQPWCLLLLFRQPVFQLSQLH